MSNANVAKKCEYPGNDLNMYFQNHPVLVNGELMVCAGLDTVDDHEVVVLVHSKSGARTTKRVTDFTWDDFNLPELGYRHSSNYTWLGYLSLSARASAVKGLTSGRLLATEVKSASTVMNRYLDAGHRIDTRTGTDNATIYFPQFHKLGDAIAILNTEPQAVGVALSTKLAVSLCLAKNYPYLLHYMGNEVAQSKDGVKWEYFDILMESPVSRQLALVGGV